MLVAIPDVLAPDELAHIRQRLEAASWMDGKVTAGEQSAKAKFNRQVPEGSEEARALGEIVLRALGRNPMFTTAALPLRVFPPLFNRYDVGMRFDAHVDNAVRHIPAMGMRIRTDVSSTLFLSESEEYDGGELVVQDTYGTHAVKLAAGSMVVYPADSLHSVNVVTRGSRWASFFWSQSMVKDHGQRSLLYEMDMGIIELRHSLPDDHPGILAMTSGYHRLLRRWAEM